MTKQATFDAVACALVKQGRPSVSEDRCMYRSPNGARCAAGHLIEDSEYSQDLECQLVTPVSKVGQLLAGKGYEVEFVRELQIAHDDAIGADDRRWHQRWVSYMHDLARRHGLSTSALDSALAKKGQP